MFLASISANSEQSENSKHSTFYLQHFNFTSSLYRDVKLYKTIPLSVMNRGSIYRKNGIIFMMMYYIFQIIPNIMFRFEGKHILLRKEMTDMIQTYKKRYKKKNIYSIF